MEFAVIANADIACLDNSFNAVIIQNAFAFQNIVDFAFTGMGMSAAGAAGIDMHFAEYSVMGGQRGDGLECAHCNAAVAALHKLSQFKTLVFRTHYHRSYISFYVIFGLLILYRKCSCYSIDFYSFIEYPLKWWYNRRVKNPKEKNILTMSRIKNLENYEKVFYAAFITYIFTYPARYGFGTAISAISETEGFSTTQLGLVTSLLFASYGIGQFLSGILGDKLKPSLLVSIGFFGSATANLIMGFARTIPVMSAAWLFNGLSCSLIWAPLVRQLTDVMPSERINKAMLSMQYCTTIGMVFTFLLVSLITAVAHWRIIFFIIAACVYGAAVLWTITAKGNISEEAPQINEGIHRIEDKKDVNKLKLFIKSGFVLILLLALYLGFLKDGIQTWVPKAINDTFGTSPALSIFLSTALPIINVSIVFFVRFLQRKLKDDDLLHTCILFGIAGIILASIAVILKTNIILTVGLFSLASACIFGVSTALTYLLPVKFAKYGCSSAAAGFTNAFTYLGSSLSGVGIGLLCESVSWGYVCLILSGLCILGSTIAILIRPVWRKFGN